MVEGILFITILVALLITYKERDRLKKMKLGGILEIEFDKEILDRKKKERKPKLQSSTFLRPNKCRDS